MKVRINITVEVDAEAWTLNYGVEGAAAIREDVVTYVRATLPEMPVPMVPVR